jgi:hypothetical protein
VHGLEDSNYRDRDIDAKRATHAPLRHASRGVPAGLS